MNIGDLIHHLGRRESGVIVKKTLDSTGEWFIIVEWPSRKERHPVADPWIKTLSRSKK